MTEYANFFEGWNEKEEPRYSSAFFGKGNAFAIWYEQSKTPIPVKPKIVQTEAPN